VRGGAGPVQQGHVPPGQAFETSVQQWLVRLDHGDVVGLLVLDEEPGMGGLGVQGVEVTTVSVKSSPASIGRKTVISLV